MLFILLIWCYLSVTFINIGFAFCGLLKMKQIDAFITLIFGMSCITWAASFWAVLWRINYEFQLFLIIIQLLILVKHGRALWYFYDALFKKIKGLHFSLKLFLLLSLLLLLIQSSGSSFLIDNETYYLQTIKWLKEYGLVPGLANLHIFLGQTSGWHILQSVFSFSFFGDNCNDLNGFCLLLGLLFSVIRLQDYFEKSNKIDLWIGLFPLALVFLTPFSGAPSPDLPVFILSLFLFYYFLLYGNTPSSSAVTVLSLLALFIIYIKISALPIVLIPILYCLSNTHKKQTNILPSLILAIMVAFLFVLKNIILTGYPLYPSSMLTNIFSFKNTIPNAIYDFWWNQAKHYDFVVSQSKYNQLTSFEIFYQWISRSSMALVVALTLFSVIFLLPFAFKKWSEKKFLWIIFAVMIVQVIFLIATTPQYRFVLSFLLFFGLFAVSFFLTNKCAIYIALYASLLITCIFILFPKPIGENQKRVKFNPNSFSISQVIIPKSNSNLSAKYSYKRKGNLNYYSPDEDAYIWVTGDGKLPCVNRKQIQYFEKNMGYIPQMNGTTLSEGFYSKKETTP